MAWASINEQEIYSKIQEAFNNISIEQKGLWRMISILPEKWKQSPYGNEGNGFWAVALIGKIVVWYNDIEEGFNYSHYKQYGIIEEYLGNQDELGRVLQHILVAIKNDANSGC